MNKSLENENEYEDCSIFEIDFKRASPILEKRQKNNRITSPCLKNIKFEIIDKFEIPIVSKKLKININQNNDNCENIANKNFKEENVIFEENVVTDKKCLFNMKKINTFSSTQVNMVIKDKKTKFSFNLKKLNFTKKKIQKTKKNNFVSLFNQFCHFDCFLKTSDFEFQNFNGNFFSNFISRKKNTTSLFYESDCVCKNKDFVHKIHQILKGSNLHENQLKMEYIKFPKSLL
jgi:hypothetical protein